MIGIRFYTWHCRLSMSIWLLELFVLSSTAWFFIPFRFIRFFFLTVTFLRLDGRTHSFISCWVCCFNKLNNMVQQKGIKYIRHRGFVWEREMWGLGEMRDALFKRKEKYFSIHLTLRSFSDILNKACELFLGGENSNVREIKRSRKSFFVCCLKLKIQKNWEWMKLKL